ncbi:MAG: cytochrome bc1 complex cytochrome b subunit [Mycobacteriales bacterium]
MTTTNTVRSRRKVEKSPAAKAGTWADERFGPSGPLRNLLNKVFPDHWSFMLGEIALYSFIILLITGTYLTFFFDPSMGETTYHGLYIPLHDIPMSRAYASTVQISFDVRGGLVIRQIHHWAALLFVAAIIVHMLRIFFTGAFRKPRETNWIIGVTLLILGIVEGFAGYGLADDLLSGTGLEIASAIMLSIPIIGTWVYYLVFGGVFPGTEIIGRLYIAHVLLIPGIILALIAVHLGLLVKQKHTQFPGPGRTEKNVIGERVLPTYAAKGAGFFAIVFGVLALLGGLVQINPIWLYGPYTPSQVGAGSQPDYYMGFLDGSTRLWPDWETHFQHHTISALFWPTVALPTVLVIIMLSYPFLEARLTKDTKSHHLVQRPRDVPVRTSLGAMSIAFYIVLWGSGGNDIIAEKFDISLNATTWIGRIMLILLPPLAYVVTYRVCLGLQMHDRQVLSHGVETGIIRRLPSGEFIELHQPLGPVDEHGHGALQYAGAPVPKKMNSFGGVGRKMIGFFTPVEEPPQLESGNGHRGDGGGDEDREKELTGSRR